MIRRPLFLGTLGFCGAILISYFLGKAAALGALGLLVFAWWQWRQAGDPAGSDGDPAGSNGVHAIRMQRQKLRKHGTAILMVFYVVSLVNVQLYELQRDPFAELEETGGVNAMAIRKNLNPRQMDIQPEMRDILMRNGMQAHIIT